MTDGKILQERFLNKIKDLIPPTNSFANELADVLGVSTDSIYRRMRNETSMTIDEISVLCNHFKVSFDVGMSVSAKNVTFNYSDLKTTDDLKNYLNRMLRDLQDLSKGDNKRIYYTAIDVPIFHHFRFPELLYFKIFYWLKGVMNDPGFSGKQYDKSLIDPELVTIGQEIYKYFVKIPSIEIWTPDTINSMIEQVQYYWEFGLFKSKDDALLICKQIEEEISVIQKQADIGNKELDEAKRTDASSFNLYQCDIEIGNNAILIEKGEAKAAYLICLTLNYLSTMQQQYCAETKMWLENLIKKSLLISTVSEKQRYRFFKSASDKVNALKTKIEAE